MPINNLNYRADYGSKELNSLYVFFCEGPTEKTLIDNINKARILKKINIKTVYIKKIDGRHFWFTPKKILDTYLNIANNEEWKYSNSEPISYTNSDICKSIQDSDTNICLLIDTDVFFKIRKTYTNLKPLQNNMLREDWRRNLNNLTHRINFLKSYTRAPLERQNYTFMEQELNFEDFFILFFEDDQIYEDWFKLRFGESDNVITEKNDRTYYFISGTLNNDSKGKEIKNEFHDLTQIPNTDEWLNNWIRANMKTEEDWEDCITRAKKRMDNNQKYTDKHGSSGLKGWPYRFGLVNFLAEHINKNV